MIRGQVDPQHEPPITGVPRVAIAVSNILESTRTLTVEAVVDTGFTGYLTLPSEIIGELGLPHAGERSARLANGEIGQFDIYTALVSWRSRNRLAPVIKSDSEPLLGMAMLWGSRLTIDSQAGGDVIIEEIPPVA